VRGPFVDLGSDRSGGGVGAALTAHESLSPGWVWSLTWDGAELGHALIARVFPDFVLAWPASYEPHEFVSPSFTDRDSEGTPIALWPTRETGIGTHLLSEPVSRVLSDSDIRRIAAGLDGDTAPDVDWVDQPAPEGFDEDFVLRWAEACFNDGRPLGAHELFLDERRLKAKGGSARGLAQTLGLDPETTRAIFRGEVAVSAEQTATLAESLRCAPDDLVGTDPADALWRKLADPDFKAEVVEASVKSGLSESETRLAAARAAYALAARDDGHQRDAQKLHDALRRLYDHDD